MKKALLFVSLTALLVPGLALAQDAGPEPETCGEAQVTYEGECDGTDAVFCSDPNEAADAEVARITCGDFQLTDGSIAGTCQVFEDWGSWCTFPVGEPCAFQTQTGGIQTYACGSPEASANEACDLSTATCVSLGAPCAEAQFGSCIDGKLALATAFGQCLLLPCSQVGGTCDAAQQACVIPEGGDCSGEPDSIFTCAAGLICTGETEQSLGTCVDTNGGEGEGEGEGGEGEGEDDENPRRGDDEEEPEPEGGCLGNAAMNSAVPPSLGLIALLGVLAIRRRRR